MRRTPAWSGASATGFQVRVKRASAGDASHHGLAAAFVAAEGGIRVWSVAVDGGGFAGVLLVGSR